jgi:hypothetical protein
LYQPKPIKQALPGLTNPLNQKERSPPFLEAIANQKAYPVYNMSKILQKAEKFPFVTSKTLEHHIELTKWQLHKLRAKLPKSIYWFQLEKGGVIHWNMTLLKSYLLHGEDSAEHRALVAEFVVTLPTAA